MKRLLKVIKIGLVLMMLVGVFSTVASATQERDERISGGSVKVDDLLLTRNETSCVPVSTSSGIDVGWWTYGFESIINQKVVSSLFITTLLGEGHASVKNGNGVEVKSGWGFWYLDTASARVASTNHGNQSFWNFRVAG